MTSVTVTWKTPYDESVWRRLENTHGHERVEAPSDDWSALLVFGPSLPTQEEPRIADLAVHHHLMEGFLHWRFNVRTAPGTDPPPELKERDTRLGGRTGLATLLLDSVPSGVPPAAVFRIRHRIDASRYGCRVLPVALRRGEGHDVALGLGIDAWMEQVGYRFEGGVNGLGEMAIIYLHRDNMFEVQILANGILRPGNGSWFPYADEITKLVRETFFIEQELEP
jgi:hypothetical protein